MWYLQVTGSKKPPASPIRGKRSDNLTALKSTQSPSGNWTQAACTEVGQVNHCTVEDTVKSNHNSIQFAMSVSERAVISTKVSSGFDPDLTWTIPLRKYYLSNNIIEVKYFIFRCSMKLYSSKYTLNGTTQINKAILFIELYLLRVIIVFDFWL